MDNLLKLMRNLGKNLGDEMTLRQLAKESKVPYTTAHRIIGANKNLFLINRKGNIKLISLNISDSITKTYLILAERKETEEFVEKNPEFKVLRDELSGGDYSLLLFGSRADGTQRAKSDVDLCIINKKGERNIKFSKMELIYDLEVNPIFFSFQEFKLMLEGREHNVGKEILKKHIVLYGEERFWNLVWKDGI